MALNMAIQVFDKMGIYIIIGTESKSSQGFTTLDFGTLLSEEVG